MYKRQELLRRIEQTFQIVLGERLLLAETPRDLVRLIRQAESEAGVQDAPAERMDSRVEREVVPRLSSAGIPERVATLIDMLDWHTQAHPNQSAIQIQGSNEQIEAAFTYAELQQGAQAVAAGLRQRGLQPRQTAAIMLPTGSDYFLSLIHI